MKISLRRIGAVFTKELTQMRRDRLTFAMMFGIPILQLLLFGYAINTDPKNLPTAVNVAEQTPIIRTLLKAMEESGYYDFVLQTDDPRQSGELIASGEVVFAVSFPAGFTNALIRGDRPQVLIEADASDPSASSRAISQLDRIFNQSLQRYFNGSLYYLSGKPPPYEIIIHRKYNPEGITQYNIVPGLLGVILTMTLVLITGISMTREVERGTMENLLALPVRPVEVMLGKITPYVFIGAMQTVVILLAAYWLFDVPFVGSLGLLLLGVTIFIIANLALGFTFSTIAKSQLQAMQLTFFFFLPSLLLSGFMFPFKGMPEWAQILGEGFPLTHFLRIVRGVMLKGVTINEIQAPMIALSIFTALAVAVAMLRYRRTLD